MKYSQAIQKQIRDDIDKDLAVVKEILGSNLSDKEKFNSLKTIFDNLAEEMATAKTNAMFDARTGLLSAKFGEEEIRREMEMSKRTGMAFSVAFIDIDFLKYINDNFGHVAGTEVIVETARLLKSSARKYDIVCRYGGDEFLFIMPSTRLVSAKKILDRFKKKVESQIFRGKIRVSISFGLSEYSTKSDSDLESVLKRADSELYQNKKERVNVNIL